MSLPGNDTSSELTTYVFPDLKALYDIELLRDKNIYYEEIEIHGFEIYIVEQWVAERRISSLITSYTGNSQDVVTAVRVCLPSKIEEWPVKFQKYYNELLQYSQSKMINNDILFITNLSAFPSTLNLLSVQYGDLRKVWNNFRTNYNLKRLNCGGRSALLLKGPTNSALDKFAQLYKIQLKIKQSSDGNTQKEVNDNHQNDENENTPQLFNSKFCPVTQLVTLIQIALNYFSVFSSVSHIDGLLCNETKGAIDRWWDEYGKFYLGRERPKNEVIMGPTTVASIFSLVLTCYFKLMVEGCMSAKDPFDEEEFYSGIYIFQKKYNINKVLGQTYLDRSTVQKLFDVSTKSSSNDIFNIKKVVKSTVHDFTGKGNFMHLSNEILTSDLSLLVLDIHGGTLGALWCGMANPENFTYRKNSRAFTHQSFNHGDPIEQVKLHYEYEKLNAYNIDTEPVVASRYDSDFRLFNNSVDPLINNNDMSENSSISSMANNYDIKNYKDDIESDVNYRNEYFRRNSSQTTITNTTCFDSFDVQPIRHSSVSQVCDIVERWDLPFDASVVKIARDLLYTRDMLRHNASTTIDNSENAPNTKKVDNIPKKDEESVFRLALRTLQRFCDKYKNNDYFEDQKHKILIGHSTLQKEVNEINILTSRFQYNIRILNARIKEVESNVDRFDTKLKNIEQKAIKSKYPMAINLNIENDKEEFEEYIELLSKIRNQRYKSICFKMLNSNIFQALHKSVKSWSEWIFHD